ncbi:hypothetical protein A6A04_13175 [Paramagnetospirillum marisnigri]|uniref:DUF4410 domain-containing protein n=1 Tax=Paramagnetospirillum marisnigri TaxID=1285242 RepID=A0A178MWK7_9PROT|nr:hypothetical protein [Paramagnetospirillum marisnigri]OAN53843.1 hypothetical protein A6A04_13175 [Paramagnetospirillum marisnigri]
MAAWWKLAMAAAVTMGLGGCLGGLPPTDSIQLAPVPGVALPHKARVMVFASESDLSRNLTIALTRFQNEETKVREGLALAKATRAMLAKGFETVEINDPAIRPHIVVKLVGKASWSRLDARLKLGCGIDAWTADGIPLGNFTNRVDVGETDYRTELEPGFAQCLKKPMEDLLTSSTLARVAGAGFRDPPGAAVVGWMRTLGPITPVK